MRIGIDIDDTITNTYVELLKLICKYYKANYNELLKENYNYLQLKAMYPNAFTINTMIEGVGKAKVKKDVKKIIKKLSINHEIYFITARNKSEYEYPYNLCYKFLKENGIYFDDLFCSIIDKGKFCLDNNIDLLIDDSVKQCESANSYGIDTIIFDAPYNKKCQLTRFDNWVDIYNYIERK